MGSTPAHSTVKRCLMGSKKENAVGITNIRSNTFAAACYDQNSIGDMQTTLALPHADRADMQTWNLTEQEWRQQLELALAVKLSEQPVPPAPARLDYDALDNFTRAYIVAALWSSHDGNGEPLDNEHDHTSLSDECLSAMAQRTATASKALATGMRRPRMRTR